MKSHDLADDYYAVGAEILRLGHNIKTSGVPQLQMIYDKVAALVI